MEETQKVKKMSYEQLEEIATQLSEQVQRLSAALQESNKTNIFKRLDYLFEVLSHKDSFGIEFLANCSKEIEDIMTIPEAEEKNEEGK